MNAAERRESILNELKAGTGPINATRLAKKFGVSRQIIVGDIALLRAAGEDISATPRGYLLGNGTVQLTRTIACCHSSEEMVSELNCIVDNGCTVVDVIVDHPIYGQLVGKLEISNRYEVQEFARRCREEPAQPLSLLTDGVHLHTIRCPSEEACQRVLDALHASGILLTD